PLRRAGVKICADTITPSLSFSYTDLESFLAAYCGTINGSTLPVGFESRRALCRARGVDGVLIHYNRSCRPWCGTLPQLGRMLAAQGWAVAAFDGDQADPAAFSPQQYAARVQGLLEMLGLASP
ncbi:MAG: 2-hydroxyacyl-CoA dehydratase, partial [Oscillospiraceae bacterium]|nr:2-hydroxyacyl-CoA dehydratase [Oscillospiraceae bacterium]